MHCCRIKLPQDSIRKKLGGKRKQSRAFWTPELEGVPAQEKGEEDVIGRQFVSESVIRSLTLGGVLDRGILHGRVTSTVLRPAPQGSVSLCERKMNRMSESADVPLSPKSEPQDLLEPSPLVSIPTEHVAADEGNESDIERIVMDPAAGAERFEEEEESEERRKKSKMEKEKKKARDAEEGKEGRSRTSSASSEDYIIILPDCFDTTRPLGESMYSSAVSQQGDESLERISADANDMLCVSQTLDSVPLTPVIVAAPRPSARSRSETEEKLEAAEMPQEEELNQPGGKEGAEPEDHDSVSSPSDAPSSCTAADSEIQELKANSITGGLVKGALSVAASAYKALFTGQSGPEQLPEEAATQDAMMAVLVEMGFADRALNQRLLQKHGPNLLDVVNELVHMQDNDWYTNRY
ncbi:next to BRCA1 gene 1 protein isoform X1 [Tachysurus ichikawai]